MSDVLLDELLVFSDHHAHPFKYGAKAEEYNGVLHNSRLLNSVKVLNEITEYANTHKITKIVFTGDLFHSRDAVYTSAFVLTQEAIVNMAQGGKQIWLLGGNHDYFDSEGKINSLAPFRLIKGVRVVTPDEGAMSYTVFTRHSQEYQLCFVPYTTSREKAQKSLSSFPKHNLSLLFAHLGMQGAKVGSDYVLIDDNDISADDVPWNDFKACFFGHFHQHQQLFQNGWYVGATHAHNWGDANTSRGFLHLKLYADRCDFEFVETSAPKFLLINEDQLDLPRNNDFVKVTTKTKLTDEQIKTMRKQMKTDNSEIIYLPPEIQQSGLSIDLDKLDHTTMLSSWIDHNPVDLDKEQLLKYGQELLQGVKL